MNGSQNQQNVIRIAMAGAAFTMAYQVAGKAARDGLFLSNFGTQHLPAMIVSGAVISILLGVITARLLTRFAPAGLIPSLTIGSGLLQAVEWLVYSEAPGWTAVAVYIHVVAIGAVITSGFWSVVNEMTDPRTAKRNFGRITAAGTFGGVAGGFAAERIAAMVNAESVLLAMCLAQLVAGALLMKLPRATVPQRRNDVRAREVLRRSPYLRSLTLLVLIGTFSAALLDYVLKVEARHVLGPGESLVRFFAVFHTATAALSFLVQTVATPFFLDRLGLGATVSTLPASVAAGSVMAAFTGSFSAIVAARALEAIVRGSLFRAGYELYYTPMLASEKRALKSINDVTVDRLGDALGGGFAQLVVSTATNANPIMLMSAAVAGGAGWVLAGRLNQGYVKSLERSLSDRAIDLDLSEAEDATTRSIVLPGAAPRPALPMTETVPLWIPPAEVSRFRELMSGNPDQVIAALANGTPIDRAVVPHVVALLACRSVRKPAVRALMNVAPQNVGQYSDFLLDHTSDLGIRIRLPRIIASAGGYRAADALLRGLVDEHFEVRFQCSRALDSLRQRSEIQVEPERVYAVVRGELFARRPPDAPRPDLDHVSALLGVVLPREPVRVAFEALENGDAQLRGLALEYLETALPSDIGDALVELFEGRTNGRGPRRPVEDIQQELQRLIHQVGAGFQRRSPHEPSGT